MGTKYIYLIRHGEYNDYENQDVPLDLPPIEFEKYIANSTKYDVGLTEKGIEQAKLTGQKMKSYPIDKIYYSSLPRARETAYYIAQAFPDKKMTVNETPDLLECLPFTDIDTAKRYANDITSEDLAIHRKHADDGMSTFFKFKSTDEEKDVHEILVCHGNIIRYFISLILDIKKPDDWLGMWIDNCGISMLRISQRGYIRLLSLNDTGHLPRELLEEFLYGLNDVKKND
ncbi:MAG: histidine phosphatase family protein [Candidatus Delongbacteria bacterium]|jgi:broad specificity phosphatase PhoE|nr:histidine phosphatase family protein [Candidatus Delongbacteria bacterium]